MSLHEYIKYVLSQMNTGTKEVEFQLNLDYRTVVTDQNTGNVVKFKVKSKKKKLIKP